MHNRYYFAPVFIITQKHCVTPGLYTLCKIKPPKFSTKSNIKTLEIYIHTAKHRPENTKYLRTMQHQTQKGHQRFTHYKSGYQSSTHFSTSEHERSAHSATSGHQRSTRCTTSRHRDLHVVHDQDTRALHNTQHMILRDAQDQDATECALCNTDVRNLHNVQHKDPKDFRFRDVGDTSMW